MANDIKLDYIHSLVQDEDMVKDLLSTFYEDGPKDFAILEKAIEDEDYEQARIYSHKLKSSLAVFKVEPLRSSCEQIEMKCKSKEGFDTIGNEVNGIKDDMSDLFDRLKSML